jgi:hypothetical protein
MSGGNNLFTVTVANVIAYAQQHTELMPLTGVGGVANEPALSIANDTLLELLAEPFPWKLNRANLPIFVTAPFKQDYLFSGSCAFTLTGGGVGIDLETNTGLQQTGSDVQVNLLESCQGILNVGDTVYLTNLTTSGINAVYTKGQGTVNSGWSNGFVITAIAADFMSFHFTYAPTIPGGTDGAPGASYIGWLEYATMTQTSSTAQVPKVWYLKGTRELQPASQTSIPDRISMLNDGGYGIITLRLRWLPGTQPWTITTAYQQRPTVISSTSSTWAPIPDNYIHVVRQMFLAMCYRYAESPKADVEFQKAIAMVTKATGADDREDAEEYIVPDEPLVQGAGWGGWDW